MLWMRMVLTSAFAETDVRIWVYATHVTTEVGSSTGKCWWTRMEPHAPSTRARIPSLPSLAKKGRRQGRHGILPLEIVSLACRWWILQRKLGIAPWLPKLTFWSWKICSMRQRWPTAQRNCSRFAWARTVALRQTGAAIITIQVRQKRSRLEAIASELEAIAFRLEAITSRLEAIASRLEAMAIRLEAIPRRLEAIASRW